MLQFGGLKTEVKLRIESLMTSSGVLFSDGIEADMQISENYLLSKSNPFEWYTYTLYNIPWPFNNRDLISAFALKTNVGKKTVTINIDSRAGHVPSKPGIERLKDYNATWTITETAPQKVHLEFTAMSNTPLMFPKYIQDPVIEKMFHNNLIRLFSMLPFRVRRGRRLI